jgi:hypothetical protein
MRLRRLFWIGAAGLLGLAALISIVALLRGDFTETDGKILLSLGAAFLAGSAALAGLALIERRDLVPLGWLVAAVGLVSFAILTWQVWVESSHEELWLDTLIAVVGALMLATSRLLHRRLEWLWWVSAALTAAMGGVLVWLVHADPSGDDWGKAVGTLGILTALAWFLVPVLGRVSGRPAERVVGRGPGTFEIELAAGETLVVR